MRKPQFVAWAVARGLPETHATPLASLAATKKEMRESARDMLPAPPIHSLDGIVEMTDEDPFGIRPVDNGFVIVGSCPNGDPIAIDVADQPGSVWYVSHESMRRTSSMREVSIRVAASPLEFGRALLEDDFPRDYFDAANSTRD